MIKIISEGAIYLIMLPQQFILGETSDEMQEPLLIGYAIVDETAVTAVKNDGKDYYKKLNKHEQWQFHQQIVQSLRPDWHSTPPLDLGAQRGPPITSNEPVLQKLGFWAFLYRTIWAF